MIKFKDFGVIEYPSYIDTVSEYLGRIREMYNIPVRKKSSSFDRGEKNVFVDVLGIKAELIAEHFLFMNGVEFTSPNLIDIKPVIAADICIGEKIKIDVKGVRGDSYELMVNERAHTKKEDVTHYWFIQPFQEGKASYWIVKEKVVDNWKVRFAGHTNAYYKVIEELIKETNT